MRREPRGDLLALSANVFFSHFAPDSVAWIAEADLVLLGDRLVDGARDVCGESRGLWISLFVAGMGPVLGYVPKAPAGK